MLKSRLLARFALVMLFMMITLGASACYKNAGEDTPPTSNRVNLTDIAPTLPASPTTFASPTILATPQGAAGATPTVRLMPTITEAPAVTVTRSQVMPSFTPLATTRSTQPVITTPGMNDIPASFTPVPTINPSLAATPTGFVVETAPCVYVVQSGDTLFSIARENNVSVDDLVAANPSFLGGTANTTLQIGWELQLPGCAAATATAQATVVTSPAATQGTAAGTPAPSSAAPSGGQTTYVVQAGDTIYSIARQFGITPDAIIAANNLVNPNRIDVGQTLIIPAAQ